MDVTSTLRFKVTNEKDLDTIAEFLEKYDCEFKKDKNTIICEENEEFVYFDDVLAMANNIIDENDEIDLELTGTTDCNGNEFQDFKITNHEGTITSFCSDWYNKLILEDMDKEDLEDLELDDQQLAEFKEKGFVYFLETEENNPRFEIELGEIDSANKTSEQYRSTDKQGSIQVYSMQDLKWRTNSIIVEMTLLEGTSPIYLLEFYNDAMPVVSFVASTESVLFYFTGDMNYDNELKERFNSVLKTSQIEYINEVFATSVKYNGVYKNQLKQMHEALINRAEETNVKVNFLLKIEE